MLAGLYTKKIPTSASISTPVNELADFARQYTSSSSTCSVHNLMNFD